MTVIDDEELEESGNTRTDDGETGLPHEVAPRFFETPNSVIRVTLIQDREVLQGDLELLANWDQPNETIWIDITSTNQGDIEPLLEEWFGFHELAAEDSLSATTLPKFDSFGGYDFFVFRAINLDFAQHGIRTQKLAAFVGRNFLVTIHGEPMEAVDRVLKRLPQDARILKSGPDFALYNVLDMLVDSHFPLLEEIEERMDEIHELIFKSPAQSLLDELLDLKRDLNVMRRYSLPQRDLFNQISRGDAKFIKQEHLIYFRDLYDHTYRIGESIDLERDLATGTMEAYLSVVANRTNDIMKVLTIFSSILLPVNLVAGIYGMNFEHMPELKWKFGYLWAFSIMGLIALLMLTWFWRRGWLPSKRQMIAHERRVKRLRRNRPLQIPQDQG